MRKRIKLLLFASYPNEDRPHWGIFNARAASELSKKVDIIVISVRTWRPGRGLIKVEEKNSVKIYHCHIPHFPSMHKFGFRISEIIVLTFLRIFLSRILNRCEIYHSVGGVPYGIYISKLAYSKKKKHILQLTGGDVNSDLPTLQKLNMLGKFPVGCTMIVGNSKTLSTTFNKLFKVDFPLRYVYRGVDLNVYKFKQIEQIDNGIKFLFIGGFSKYPDTLFGMNTKGGIDLMKSWQKNEGQLKVFNATLTIGGPDSENAFDYINKLNHPELVSLVGELTPDQVIEMYDTHHVIIIPSREEGLPNVALEAAASGRPVIASNAGGIPEVVDNSTGSVYPKGEVDQLSDLLLHYASGREDIAGKGRAARERMECHFDKAAFAEKYFKYYEELVR